MQMQEYSYEGGESSLELMPTSIGQEDCRPGHSFGPGERNTYLIHYVLRGCGIFCVGGGYASMPLIQAAVVDTYHWMSLGEFVDIFTISQMTPGPIAINAATFVGLRVAGVSGALAATVGCMLPSCVLVTLLARLYLRYRKLSLLQGVLTSLRPAVVAMIASAGVSILVTAFWDEAVTFAGTNWRLVVIFASSLLLLRRTKLSPILVMTLAGAANLLLELIPFPS